ncbi:MAG: hypothetical protein ACSHW1_07250 [Yoonia sp.]|uniref:hypothetical protein n=1 Tax=Yoonia sp. TaxID=2212373 RepID=UPI003EF5DD4B
MSIDFALSLSFEGIELLHRTARGWRRLGRAKVGSSSMDADLTAMRQKAISIAPEAVTTKLIIPADQIKYTAIDSTQTSQDDIEAKLEGETPYAISELVIDYERFGGRTHIAAVARETLDEAEAFAKAHGFNPVAFVAIPEPFTFQKEVFFGPTKIMPSILGANAQVERDTLPVMIIGTRLKSRLLVMDDTPVIEEVETPDLFDTLVEVAGTTDTAEDAPAVPEKPVAQVAAPAARQAIWCDAIPAEVHTAPTAIASPQEAVPAQEPEPRKLVLAELPYFDAVIAEVHQRPKSVRRPALVANAAVSSATKPAVAAPVAQRRAPPAPANSRAKPLALVGGLVLAAALGGVLWTQLPQTAAEPVQPEVTAPAVASVAAPQPPTPATTDVAPQVPLLEISALAGSATPATDLPSLGASQPPLAPPRPTQLVTEVPDAVPPTPQAPPAPPVEVAQEEDAAPAEAGRVLSPDEAEAAFATTGVWQRAPRLLDTPSGVSVLGFVAPAAFPVAPRLPQPSQISTLDLQGDLPFVTPADPPPPGVTFERDEDGFIAATPEGTVTPQGAVVIAGAPPLNTPLRPQLSEADLARMALLAPAPVGVVIIAGRPDNAPDTRPADLQISTADDSAASTTPAPSAGGVGLASLELQNSGSVALDSETVEARAEDDLRPQLRPNGLAEVTAASAPAITDILTEIATEDATLRFDNSTSLAVRASLRPADRPSNFGQIVAAAQRTAPPAAATTTAAAPVAAPAPPQNYDPIPGSVARAATQEGVIRLRDMNLIGVYGRSNARRALVRLSNGRYVRVEVGSELDGGQVTAIGDDALNYVKRGRTYAIGLPDS